MERGGARSAAQRGGSPGIRCRSSKLGAEMTGKRAFRGASSKLGAEMTGRRAFRGASSNLVLETTGKRAFCGPSSSAKGEMTGKRAFRWPRRSLEGEMPARRPRHGGRSDRPNASSASMRCQQSAAAAPSSHAVQRLFWRASLAMFRARFGPHRLARPRTRPFQGCNTGSNPVGDALHGSFRRSSQVGERRWRTRVLARAGPGASRAHVLDDGARVVADDAAAAARRRARRARSRWDACSSCSRTHRCCWSSRCCLSRRTTSWCGRTSHRICMAVASARRIFDETARPTCRDGVRACVWNKPPQRMSSAQRARRRAALDVSERRSRRGGCWRGLRASCWSRPGHLRPCRRPRCATNRRPSAPGSCARCRRAPG